MGVRRLVSMAAIVLAVAPTVACKRAPTEAPEPNAVADAPPTAAAASRDEVAVVDPSGDPNAAGASAGDAAPRPADTIYRSELDRVTQAGPAYVLRELGPEPFRYSGRFVGWEITRVFPDDPVICRGGCDLQAGDIILSVNGSRLETPQQLSDEFDKLSARSDLSVVWLRDEKRHAVRYAIVDDPPAKR